MGEPRRGEAGLDSEEKVQVTRRDFASKQWEIKVHPVGGLFDPNMLAALQRSPDG